MAAETVKIGEHVLKVVPQRHARLRNRLSGEDFQRLLSADYAHETYRVLSVLIPDLPRTIPEWEWEGYANEQARHDGVYEEDADKSPTTAEIVDAFEKAIMVSGAGRLGKLLGLVQDVGRLTEQAGQQVSQSENSTPASPVSLGSVGESA